MHLSKGEFFYLHFCDYEKEGFYTYLAGENSRSRRWFSQGEACLFPSDCADPCYFLKCGELNCMICGGGALCFCFPPQKRTRIVTCVIVLF